MRIAIEGTGGIGAWNRVGAWSRMATVAMALAAGACASPGRVADGGIPNGGNPNGSVARGSIPNGGNTNGGVARGGIPNGGAGAPASADAVACSPAPASANADAALARAIRAMGVPDGGVLTLHTRGRYVQDFQSDRTYPPFFAAYHDVDHAYDVASRAERITDDMMYPGGGPPLRTSITDAHSTWMVRDSSVVEFAALDSFTRPHRLMNPWAVLGDWVAAGDARVVSLCPYRDDLRLVLERTPARGTAQGAAASTADGTPERLFLDRESGFPVKLDHEIASTTWGQMHEEVLWSTWQDVGAGAVFPIASFILRDGQVVRDRTVGTMELVDAADPAFPDRTRAAADPSAPTAPAPPRSDSPEAMRPDTVRLGDGIWYLAHRFYNEAVVITPDTVWVLDATLNETRAAEDAARIAQLGGAGRPVAVVVTDLAWPHIGGVRWWVSQGATIVAHRSAEPFLRRIVERRWTLTPDALERRRARGPVPFHFVAVDDAADVAGGRLRIREIGGIGSEGALMVFDRPTRFLWAGDWIQDTANPSEYAREVVAAVRRAGFDPERVGAQHIPVVDWSVIAGLHPGG